MDNGIMQSSILPYRTRQFEPLVSAGCSSEIQYFFRSRGSYYTSMSRVTYVTLQINKYTTTKTEIYYRMCPNSDESFQASRLRRYKKFLCFCLLSLYTIYFCTSVCRNGRITYSPLETLNLCCASGLLI